MAFILGWILVLFGYSLVPIQNIDGKVRIVNNETGLVPEPIRVSAFAGGAPSTLRSTTTLSTSISHFHLRPPSSTHPQLPHLLLSINETLNEYRFIRL